METQTTNLSKRSYYEATSGRLTIEDAIGYLEEEVKIRSFREKLERFYKGQNLRQTLVDGLMRNAPDSNRESVEKRVRTWLNNDKFYAVKKQDAIELCFILELSIEEADQFVTMVSEEALHWRNPDEIVYIFALNHRMEYRRAQELEQQMATLLANVTEKKTLEEDSFTPVIRREISALGSEEELAEYLQQAAPRLGRRHNTAYDFFMERLAVLEHPQQDEETAKAHIFEPEHLSIREILKEYMFSGNVLYAKKLVKKAKKESADIPPEEKMVFTEIQKNISSSWPEETTISKMKQRKEDVTRKVLILLFLATDQGLGPEEDEEEEYGQEPTVDDVFEDLCQRLNDMLISCGYSELDPRAPFDWLILYCMCVQDMPELDMRMRRIFKEMFGEQESGS
ncbi:MAG: hypothetical protein IJ711_05785 [Lachnospiraceae bacterium]|nr:hypothetical protein [Lachnospiraceae bacterium]